MTFIIQNFGPNLARLRIEKGVSQTQLAEDLGIGKQSVSDYEKQKSYLTFANLDSKWSITRPFNKNLPALRLADFYYLVLFFLQLSGNSSDQGISFFNSFSGTFSLGYLRSSFSKYAKYS